MTDISNIINMYSKKENIFDKEGLDIILNYYADILNVRNYISNIIIINNKKYIGLAYYSESTQKIYINYNKLIYSLGKYFMTNELIKDYKSKILAINMYIVKIILHELFHACQEKEKKENSTSFASELILQSEKCQKFLENNLDYYNNKMYSINPMEKDAELKSLDETIRICNYIEFDKLSLILSKEYKKYALNGYCFEHNRMLFPYQIFFDKYINNLNNDFLMKIHDYSLSKDLKDNLQYGIDISIDDYQKYLKRESIS